MKPRSFFTRLFRRLDKTISSFFFLDQWAILTAKGAGYDSLQWSMFRSLIPEKDRYWADPFVVDKDNNYYIFIEEKIYATGRGRIACLMLDKEGYLKSQSGCARTSLSSFVSIHLRASRRNLHASRDRTKPHT